MTEPRTTVERMATAALIVVDAWGDLATVAERLGGGLGGRLPARLRATDLAGGWRAMRVEPTAWWLAGPFAALDTALAAAQAALGEDGAAVDLSGGFAKLEVAGPRWRELLMIGGVFDAETAAFGPGSTVGTILHHASVRYDVIDDGRVHIFVAPSYAHDLLGHLRAAAARL